MFNLIVFSLTLFVMYLINVVLHEAAHGMIAAKMEVPVTGCDIGTGPVVKTWYTKNGCPVRIHPVIINASVMLDPYRLDETPVSKRILIHAAGSASNIVLAMALSLIYSLFSCLHFRSMSLIGANFVKCCSESMLYPFRIICGIIHPAVHSPGGSSALNLLMSADIIQIIAAAVMMAAVMSASLGILNLLPFVPLDGGHIVIALIGKIPELVNGKKIRARTEDLLYVLSEVSALLFLGVIFLRL